VTFQGSGSIEGADVSGGGGGGGGGRIALGGGAGLIITIVALLFGVNPGQILGNSTNDQSSTTSSQTAIDQHLASCTYEMANQGDAICRIKATAASLNVVWPNLMDGYTAPRTKVFSGSVNTGCGAATSATGPFYCPADQTVYVDPTFFDDVLVGQLGGSNDALSQEYVIAHEFGHHVENLTGVLTKGQRMGNNGSVRIELQADCLAGVWANHADDGSGDALLKPLTPADIQRVGQTAKAIGDDSIQGANSNREGWTHGSAEQRSRWFGIGYQSGDPRKCDTFATNDL